LKRLIAIALPLAGLARVAYRFLLRPRTRGAKVILVNGGEVLLLRHTYEFGRYGLPGGGLDGDEDPLAGLKREVKEELGIELAGASMVGIVESDADYNRDTVHVFTAELPSRDGLSPDPIEIAEVRWTPPDAVPAVGPVTQAILHLYERRRSGR
jgi:8-oxo-dGTP pyrophosphatase MutT (NUDIX family)